MSQLFTSGGQSTGVSTLASFLPMNTQGWSPWGWTGWISLQSKGLSRVFSNTTLQKHQFFGTQLSSQSNSHSHYMTTGKTIALTRRTFVGKEISLLFNLLSRLVITFLPRSKCLLISWLQSPSSLREDPNDGTLWPQRRGNHHRSLDSCYSVGLEVSSVHTKFCTHSSILEWLWFILTFLSQCANNQG